jgi:hypothetical protein
MIVLPQIADVRVAYAQDDCFDVYEPDDNLEQARPFVIGSQQSRTFCPTDNEDWVSFNATAGTFYRITASNLLPTNNAVLELYASDGTTLLTEDDDTAGNRASLLVWQPTETGMVYVRVRQWADNGYPGLGYDLTIAPTVCNES